MKKSIFASLLVICFMACFAVPAIADKPNIMIIGDSISLGYCPKLQQLMGGKANVYHHEGNAASTRGGARPGKIESYLSAQYDGEVRKWDVVVFNYGLWDVCYRGGFDKPISTDINTFEKRIEWIAKEIQRLAPDAKVIWANITAIPKGGEPDKRKEGDSARYNEVAAKVMKKLGVPECDLWTLTKNFDASCAREGNVHFTDKGYEEIAKLVMAKIEQELGGGGGGVAASAPAEESVVGREVGIKRKTGLCAADNPAKMLGYLTPGMTVKILEEVSSAKVKVTFTTSSGKSFEGVCSKADLEL